MSKDRAHPPGRRADSASTRRSQNEQIVRGDVPQSNSGLLLDELLGSIREGIFFISPSGEILDANPALVRMLGYDSKEELQSHNFSEIYKDRVGRKAFMQRLSHDGSFQDMDIILLTKSGQRIACLASGFALKDMSGRIERIQGTLVDITKRREMERRLAQKEKLAAMGEMTLGAAHELNNPITAILGVSDLLCQQAADETSCRRATMIHEHARRASSIVQSLLIFSQRSSRSHAKLCLKDLMQRALRSHHTTLTEKNIGVKFEVSEDLPSVEGDPELLVRAFSNIIANAEQSISAARNQGSLTISLSTTKESDVVVSLADDGVGIPPENIAKIFDPFFTTKRPSGSGLGLTICLAIIRDHGGTIDVQSAPGVGATFQVVLPVAARPSAQGLID